MDRKSWADRQGILTGVYGEVINGIPIQEKNRATVYEFRKAGIEVLQKITRENYIEKGVQAVLFGILDEDAGLHKYAVFVQSGFLQNVEEEDD